MLGDLANAESSYAMALKLCGSGPACAWPLMQMGFLHSRTQGEKGQKYFRQAIEARPDWAKPHFYLGKSLVAAGNLGDAQKEFETAIRLDDSKSDYHYQLARLYLRLGKKPEAEREMSRYQALAKLEHGTAALESDAQ
jgi:tetratricopeptide (TPR) repeat protein